MSPDRKPGQVYISRRNFVIGSTLVVGSLVLDACAKALPFSFSGPSDVIKPTQTGSPDFSSTDNEIINDPNVLTPERPNAVDGIYTSEQLSLIETNKFIDQEKTLADWTKYVWSEGNNPLFNKETTKLKYTYLFDPKKPGNAGVCLQSPDFPDVCMIPPIDSNAGNGFLPTPTDVIDGDIPKGHEPTMLDINMDVGTVTEFRLPEDCVDSKLGWENGVWVRYSTNSSRLVASLSVEGAGAWVGPDYAERYTPVWSENYIGKVGDIEIPIFFGITENVVNPTNKELTETVLKLPPIKKIHINSQEAVDLTAKFFMHACHYRYTEMMGNKGVSFEDYLKLVSEGEGKIQVPVFDTNSRGFNRWLGTIDPSQGLSVVWTNDKKMVVEFNTLWGFYFGVDGRGRLLSANSVTRNFESYIESWTSINGADYLIYDSLQGIMNNLGATENKCMSTSSVLSVCGDVSAPSDFRNWQAGFREMYTKIQNGELQGPIFTIER